MVKAVEDPRFVLGLKLRNLRSEQGRSLKDVAERASLSISYLSEIEKGRKYPKPEKLLRLAGALDVSYDELVSLKLDEDLDTLRSVFSSTLLREFPFDLFGLRSSDLVGLISEDPQRAGALIRAFMEVGRLYDVQVEHFLFAALRSYQQMHGNYFAGLEDEAAAYRRRRRWQADEPLGEGRLRAVLEEEHGYHVDFDSLAGHRDLGGLRSVLIDGTAPKLLVNGGLLPAQRAFVLGREIGYRHLGLGERAMTSSWLEVESFEQLLNNFKASYFSGALLIDRRRLRRDLARFFALKRWDSADFLALLARNDATPEMFFYRLTELVPALFGLPEIFFLRFTEGRDGEPVALTKVLNMSTAPVPHGIGRGEHHCRRWPAPRLLAEIAAGGHAGPVDAPDISIERTRFIDPDVEFLVISIARPLALSKGRHSCVSLGFQITETFRRKVRFWNDPAIPQVDVGLTCERCPLSEAECDERAAPPMVRRRRRERRRKQEALAELLDGLRGAG